MESNSSKRAKKYVLSKRILPSETAIGAFVSETDFGHSKVDCIHKLAHSLKDATDTKFWLNLLHLANTLKKETFAELSSNGAEPIKKSVSSMNSSKSILL